jgi:hypothetical protein
MKNAETNYFCKLISLIVLSSLFLVSCGKKEVSQAVPPPEPVAEAPAAVSAPAPSPVPQPNQDNTPMDTRISEAKAAMKAKNYDKAIEAVSIPQRTVMPMTGEQLNLFNNTKADVINQLLAAAAAGDAKAKAAFEELRRRSMQNR